MLIEQRTHGLILLVRPDEVPAVQDPGRERWEWAVTGKPDQVQRRVQAFCPPAILVGVPEGEERRAARYSSRV